MKEYLAPIAAWLALTVAMLAFLAVSNRAGIRLDNCQHDGLTTVCQVR